MTRQVVAIKWGDAFGPEYVNRLYGMVRRNLSGPFRFFLLTDDSTGIRPEVTCLPLPELGCDLPVYAAGIWGKGETRSPLFGVWGKVRLWNPDLCGITGDVLFLDLDLVVTGSLDPFFDFDAGGRVVLARSAIKPFRRAGQSSVYRFRVGQLAPLFHRFQADPQAVANRHKMEQDYLTEEAPGGVAFWPRGWVQNFRRSCVPAFPLNYLRAPFVPRAARVVIFPGGLNPPDAIAGRWGAGSEPRPPLDHLRAGLRGERTEPLLKHLRHYIRPAEWVARRWTE